MAEDSNSRRFLGGAELVALIVVAVAAIAGGFVGYALVDVQCDGACQTPRSIGTFSGAIFAGIGVGIIATLALRAFREWRAYNRNNN